MYQVVFCLVVVLSLSCAVVVFSTMVSDVIEIFRKQNKSQERTNCIKSTLIESIKAGMIIFLGCGVLTLIAWFLSLSSKNYKFEDITKCEISTYDVTFDVKVTEIEKEKNKGYIYYITLRPRKYATEILKPTYLFFPARDYNSGVIADTMSSYIDLILTEEEYETIIGKDCTIVDSKVYVLELESKGNLGQKYTSRLTRFEMFGDTAFYEEDILSIKEEFIRSCNNIETSENREVLSKYASVLN